MKAYINEVDWSDEGDIFFFSLSSEERLAAIKELLLRCEKYDLFPEEVEMWWGTNEAFNFSAKDLIEFIDDAVNITPEELSVFKKFAVSGFDIYGNIEWEIKNCLMIHYDRVNEDLTQEILDDLKPLIIQIFGLKEFDKIQNCLNNEV